MLTPWMVPSFVVAVLWQFMWQSDVRMVDKVLVNYTHLLGERPIWLLGEDTPMWAMVSASVWRRASHSRDDLLPRRARRCRLGSRGLRRSTARPELRGGFTYVALRCCGR